MKQGRSIAGQSKICRDIRKTCQGYVDIKTKTSDQLNELIERQNKLLKNKPFLEKLPDKGKKTVLFKTELETELMKRQKEYDATCQLMSSLSLVNKNAEDIEWGEGKSNKSDMCETQLDSDDDDDDDKEEDDGQMKDEVVNPLKIMATHSGTAGGRIIEINSCKSKSIFQSSHDNGKPYVDKICEKYGTSVESKERFKPNQLRNNDFTLYKAHAEKVKKVLGNKWEVTEATPPAPIYNGAVMISLSESLILQKKQAEKLKELEKRNATEKLLQHIPVKMGDKLPIHNITEYRSNGNALDETVKVNDNYEFNDSNSDDSENTLLQEENNEWQS